MIVVSYRVTRPIFFDNCRVPCSCLCPCPCFLVCFRYHLLQFAGFTVWVSCFLQIVIVIIKGLFPSVMFVSVKMKPYVWLQTADGSIQQVEEEVAMFCPLICREILQSGMGSSKNSAISLPQRVNPAILGLILDYCRFHQVAGRSNKVRLPVFSVILQNCEYNLLLLEMIWCSYFSKHFWMPQGTQDLKVTLHHVQLFKQFEAFLI